MHQGCHPPPAYGFRRPCHRGRRRRGGANPRGLGSSTSACSTRAIGDARSCRPRKHDDARPSVVASDLCVDAAVTVISSQKTPEADQSVLDALRDDRHRRPTPHVERRSSRALVRTARRARALWSQRPAVSRWTSSSSAHRGSLPANLGGPWSRGGLGDSVLRPRGCACSPSCGPITPSIPACTVSASSGMTPPGGRGASTRAFPKLRWGPRRAPRGPHANERGSLPGLPAFAPSTSEECVE